jgi:hypothetical protein
VGVSDLRELDTITATMAGIHIENGDQTGESYKLASPLDG